jgi:iron complex outermembrane receptor protein
MRGHSPKLALAYSATDSLLLKLSAGRGVRFPNVEELYNGTVTASSQTLSDPQLKAETSDAVELSAEQEWESQRLRVSLFFDDVKDAILRQSTTDPAVCKTTSTGATNYTCVQNVDRVQTTGIELAWAAQDWGVKGVNIEASAAYTFRSEVAANRNDPAMVGQWWLRVPRTRATLQASWRPDDRWLLAAGWRHQGRAYNDPYNVDRHPEVWRCLQGQPARPARRPQAVAPAEDGAGRQQRYRPEGLPVAPLPGSHALCRAALLELREEGNDDHRTLRRDHH